ncbi:UDP-2,3-diacetamido-2,3-dideoxy-D-glucuronate 2-epimerase [Synechococcus sp. MIT S9509]|uniref:non-hydrolyzing UDP-N-acetylglucosamine 2-epimerase n=1 Tax=Synechococcus sp. MIT S9509 TaxID=1801630 RepID=UPI0007BC2A6C|nr:UDP-N-acetylglucosamine 2-epimerase (non-hydrolyzing) [Synechococcus sp. MIT S9509]KZR93753.1 UDP-2,3-diacetamido-2,3-dideoxy-D-glucuronate 2-epimerase [Synechococcus sp. MIT S9509]
MRILTVVGARPQFIKAAALSRAISAMGNVIQEQILHTGQHYDAAMSDQFFSELGIPAPAFHLGIGGGSHGANTGRMLEGIEQVLLEQRPDALLVYGDTDSTLAGGLAASKLKIPVVHVEAGLRSFNRHQPEEQNRVLIDHLADLCFAPTDSAVAHLRREGIADERIVRSGDVMADAARLFGEEAEQRANELMTSAGLQVMAGGNQPFVLATIHRAENTDDPVRLEAILKALAAVAIKGVDGHDPYSVLLPLHPRTKARIDSFELEHLLEPLTLTPPLGFMAMVLLERKASLVVTDSGGVQKEAFLQGTPCVTVRTETEWVELLECGWNLLADPSDTLGILKAMHQQLAIDIKQPRPQLYGDGYAAKEIMANLMQL